MLFHWLLTRSYRGQELVHPRHTVLKKINALYKTVPYAVTIWVSVQFIGIMISNTFASNKEFLRMLSLVEVVLSAALLLPVKGDQNQVPGQAHFFL